MIKRKIDRYLADFFDTDRKALMLTGARQIGKTYSIRRFGHEHFERFVEINFIENPSLVKVFSKAKNCIFEKSLTGFLLSLMPRTSVSY